MTVDENPLLVIPWMLTSRRSECWRLMPSDVCCRLCLCCYTMWPVTCHHEYLLDLQRQDKGSNSCLAHWSYVPWIRSPFDRFDMHLEVVWFTFNRHVKWSLHCQYIYIYSIYIWTMQHFLFEEKKIWWFKFCIFKNI